MTANPNLPAARPSSAVAPEGLYFGSSQLDMQDFVPPRVKIIQAMSDEKGDEYPEGTFYNTLTSEGYGPTIGFIPLHTFKNRVLLVRNERRAQVNAALEAAGLPTLSGDAEGLSCRSLDMIQGVGTPGVLCDECPLSLWTGDGDRQPPLCSETYNVAAITTDTEDHPGGDLIILGFSRASAKAGKRLFSMLRLTPGRPMWASMYEASTREEKGEKGRYWVPVVKKLPGAPPDELLRVARDFAIQLQGQVIDVTPAEEDEPTAPAPGEAPWEQPA